MIKDIFPIKIYETTFENYQEVKSTLVDQILPFFHNKEEHRNNLFSKGFSTSKGIKDLHTQITAPELLNFIDLHLNNYWISCGFSKLLKPYILHSWANLVPPGGSLQLHNHNPNVIAGSFYVSANSTTGNLKLENPLNLLLGRMPWDRSDISPILFEEEVDVCDGKLVLFPGWLNHRTLINSDNTDRIVLGFNFACHGERMKFNEVY
jgi:uncharacterized protein (TIGR02466 family)